MQDQLIRAGIGLWSRVLPSAAAHWLAGQFFRARPGRQKDWEKAIPEAREISMLSDGLAVRHWGQGPRVMLVHGWEGRFSQFAVLVPMLVDAGFEVVALDPPGHGLSEAEDSNPVKFGAAIHAAAAALGPFFAIIGHSMGATGAVIALSNGTAVERVALLSMPASLQFHLQGISRKIGFGAAATNAFLRNVDRIVGVPAAELDARRLAAKRREPMLIVHDRSDPQVPYTHAEQVAASWPGARKILSDQLGHNRILADRGVCRQLVDFLTERPADLNSGQTSGDRAALLVATGA